MMKKLVSTLKTGAFMVGAALVTLYSLQYLNDHQQKVIEKQETTIHQVIGRPYIHRGDGNPNPNAHPGDIIYVHNKYIRTMRCSMAVANLLIDPRTNNVHHWTTFQNWLPAGTFEANEFFHVPEWLPPATYRVVKRTTATCDGAVYYFVNFDLDVVISPRSPPEPTPPTSAKARPPRRHG